jgi:Ni,Fe-hydrogenase III component G
MPPNELDNQLSPIRDKLAGVERKTDHRVFLACESAHVYEVCRFLFHDLGLRFVISTGIDAQDCFEVLHHFSDDGSGRIVTVKAFVRDRAAPELDSITPLIPGAEWIEREMHDLLGIRFRNHPNLRRLILADDWPAGVYPLRKEVQA